MTFSFRAFGGAEVAHASCTILLLMNSLTALLVVLVSISFVGGKISSVLSISFEASHVNTTVSSLICCEYRHFDEASNNFEYWRVGNFFERPCPKLYHDDELNSQWRVSSIDAW